MSTSITVFIVDGDESVRRAMARLMTAAGFRASCSQSVEELLDTKLPVSDAVILVDVDTARQFTMSLPEKLHAREQCLPVIYLTGYDTEWKRREVRDAGAAGLFRKPVDEQALVDAIVFAVDL